MESHQVNWIVNFFFGIADDMPHDLYLRGKYYDIILPVMVLSPFG